MVSASGTALMLDRVVMREASSLTLLDSSIVAVGWRAVLIAASNLTASSIALQRTSVVAASRTVVLEASTLSATSMTLLDCNLTSLAEFAVTTFVATSWWFSSSRIVLHRTTLSGAHSVFMMQGTALHSVDTSLVDSILQCSSKPRCLLITDSLVTGGSALVLFRTTIALLSSQPSIAGGSSAVLLLANSTETEWRLTVADSTLAGASGYSVLHMLNCSVAACNIRVLHSTLTAFDAAPNDAPLKALEDAAGALLIERCVAYAVYVVVRHSAVV